jgi:hypothetical protein
VAIIGMAILVQRFDALPVLVACIGLAVGLLMLRKPQLATLLVAFLLYTNIPVVAYQFHGVPKVLAGSFMLLLALPLAHFLVLRHEPLRVDKVFVLLVCFLAAMILSSFGARDVDLSVERLQVFFLEGLALYWLLLNTVRDLPALRRVIWTVLAAGALLGSLSLYQMATRSYDQQFGGLAQRTLTFVQKENRNAPGQAPRMYRSDRAEGPMGETNTYAQVMIVLLPLAWAMIRSGRSARLRLAGAVTGALILGGVVATYSRGAMLALAFLALAATRAGWIRPRVLLIAGLAGLISLPIVAPAQVQRLVSIAQVQQVLVGGDRTQTDASIRGRLTEMLAATMVFVDHPVLGVGPGQYTPFYSQEYQDRPEIKFRDIGTTRRAHSLYAEMAAETGVLGLGIFLAMVFVTLMQLWRERARWTGVRPELADLATALWLSILGYLVTGIFLSMSYERYYWFLLAISGIALYLMNLELKKEALGSAQAAQAR